MKPPLPLIFCVVLVSTLNFPKVDLRPDFLMYGFLGLHLERFGDLVNSALQAMSSLSLLLLVVP